MRESFWETQSGREALAARHMDRLVLNEALTVLPICFQCGETGKPGIPIGRRDWLCTDCSQANDRRYRDEYGDASPLEIYQGESR